MLRKKQIFDGSSRRFEIDALRGFAIVGIFLYHSVTQFNFPSTFTQTNPVLTATDSFITRLSYLLLAGKMFGIFALLFGYTTYLQNEKPASRGKYVYAVRMIILLLFGLINSLFFPDGDILVLYALIGILMLPFVHLKLAALLTISILLLVQPVQLYHLIMAANDTGYTLPVSRSAVLKSEIHNVIMQGNFLQVMKTNLLLGVPASLTWEFESGRIFQAAGLFIIGMLIRKKGIFRTKVNQKKFWKNIMILFTCLAAIVYALKFFYFNNLPVSTFKTAVYTIAVLWLNTIGTLLIVTVFTFLYLLNKGKAFHPLTYLGRMSLTNYIAQSILGAFIFSPFGFNFANTRGITYSIIVTCCLLLFQLILSRAWLLKHAKGPLEHLWAYLTHIFTDNKKLVTKEIQKI